MLCLHKNPQSNIIQVWIDENIAELVDEHIQIKNGCMSGPLYPSYKACSETS